MTKLAKAASYLAIVVIIAVAAHQVRLQVQSMRGRKAMVRAAAAAATQKYAAEIACYAPEVSHSGCKSISVHVVNGEYTFWNLCDGVITHRSATPAGGPLSPPLLDDVRSILKSYHVRLLETGHRNGYTYDLIEATPRVAGKRPTVLLSIERASGLLMGVTKVSPKREMISRWEVSRLTFGDRDTRDTRGLPELFYSRIQSARDSDMSSVVGSEPKMPSWAPSGFRLAHKGTYKCPCGCLREFAAMRYSDGLASYTVFQSDASKPLCAAATVGGKAKDDCTVSSAHGATMAARTVGKVYAAVAGDIAAEEARRILGSL